MLRARGFNILDWGSCEGFKFVVAEISDIYDLSGCRVFREDWGLLAVWEGLVDEAHEEVYLLIGPEGLEFARGLSVKVQDWDLPCHRGLLQ